MWIIVIVLSIMTISNIISICILFSICNNQHITLTMMFEKVKEIDNECTSYRG